MNRFALLLLTALGGAGFQSQAQQICNNQIPESTPASAFTLDKGMATHHKTGLMWMRCALGQTWNGSTCTGSATYYDWRQALQRAANATYAGYGDWRLPNNKELASIVERRCGWPAVNATVFPNAPASWFWSSSVGAGAPDCAWSLNFSTGDYHYYYNQEDAAHIRLVRGGQDPLSPPPGATLIAPRSMITDNTPTYQWNAVAGATKYYLKVRDSAGIKKIGRWYTAARAGCGGGVGTCAVTPPDKVLTDGAYKWWIQTWNAAGKGPWSAALAFEVNSP